MSQINLSELNNGKDELIITPLNGGQEQKLGVLDIFSLSSMDLVFDEKGVDVSPSINKGDLSLSANIPNTRKNRRSFKAIQKAVFPLFKIDYRGMPIVKRIILWCCIKWAKLQHKKCLVVNDNETKAILFDDINRLL